MSVSLVKADAPVGIGTAGLLKSGPGLRVSALLARRHVLRDWWGVGTHRDPLTGEYVNRIPGGKGYTRLVCTECIGYTCECGTAGEGC